MKYVLSKIKLFLIFINVSTNYELLNNQKLGKNLSIANRFLPIESWIFF